jgi:hypothetical protein
VPLPPVFFVFLGTATLTYMLLVQLIKRRFMQPAGEQRHQPRESAFRKGANFTKDNNISKMPSTSATADAVAAPN